jgi:hypothetical protein
LHPQHRKGIEKRSRIVPMRRAFSVASSGLRLAGLLGLAGCIALAPAALAQRGGGHGGGFGGGHAGGFSSHSFGGGFSSHSFGGFSGSVGRSSSFGAFGSRGYSYAPRMTWPAPARGFAPAGRSSYGIADRSRYGGYGRDRYRSPYRGYGNGYYPGNSWGVLPWEFGYPDFSGYDNGSWVGQSDTEASDQDPGYDAGPQEEYRPAYGEPGSYARAAVAAPIAEEPALTLIFNDGHQQSIRNYALTSNYLLVLDDGGSGRQQRIRLTDLNLPATQRAAQSAGLDFAPPPSTAPAAF